ncbi:hypothetical protein ACWDPV_15225 [Gordonia sp. NPDC003504]
MSTASGPSPDNDALGNHTSGDDVPGTAEDRSRRAPGVALIGVAALAVAGWGLADGPTLPDPATLGWLVVGVGVVIGALLILSGTRSSRRS